MTPFTATLNFANVANETGYQILRSATGAAGSFVDIGAVAADTTSFTDTGLTRGSTPYFYQVQAFNNAGASAPVSVNLTTTANGVGSVNAYYYNDQYWKSGNANASTQPGLAIGLNPDVTTIVDRPNFDWGTGSPDAAIRADNFSTTFTGKIRAPETGTYTILGFSDDDSYVWVDGHLVSGDPGGHGIPANDAGGHQRDRHQAHRRPAGQHRLRPRGRPERGRRRRGHHPPLDHPQRRRPQQRRRRPGQRPQLGRDRRRRPPTAFASPGHTANTVDFTFTDNATNELRYELVRSQDNFATSSVVAVGGIQSPEQTDSVDAPRQHRPARPDVPVSPARGELRRRRHLEQHGVGQHRRGRRRAGRPGLLLQRPVVEGRHADPHRRHRRHRRPLVRRHRECRRRE